MSNALFIRASVVKVGQSDSYTLGFWGNLPCGFSGKEAQKPRWMQVRTRGRPVSVTVARLNSAKAPPIFSRWEANSGFQGAGVAGVGWEADITWWRRWVRREVVVWAARVVNWE